MPEIEPRLKLLQSLGPFKSLDATVSPFDIAEGMATALSNVDVSANPGAFATAAGRQIISETNVPYTQVVCVVPFYSYNNTAAVSACYVMCLSNPYNSSQFGVYYYDTNSHSFGTIASAAYFTEAVQFNSCLWTNGGQVFRFTPSGGGYKLVADPWQIQVGPQYAFNISATATTGTSPGQQYQYAITWRRAFTWTPLISGSTRTPGTVWYPDLDTYQESSPIFTPTFVTTTAQAPALSVLNGLSQTVLETGTQTTSTYLAAVYRWSTANPTFTFIDYLINLTRGTGVDGNPCWLDPYTDSQLTNNATLDQHQDPPPIIGQVYPGPANSNISIINPQEQLAQQAFTYTNPAFIAKYKNRLWCFTTYPNQPLLPAATGPHGVTTTRVSFQPQLWYSDAGIGFSFNDNTGYVLVGPEDAPGNYQLTSAVASASPWEPFLIPDTPVGMAEAGSLLAMFKTNSTWIMFGDTPNDFAQSVRNAFNIGCAAPDSITPAEGGFFWLAPEGVYFYDGGSPSYIGEQIRLIVSNYPDSTYANAQGAYSPPNRTFYLSFPGEDVTYAYYVPLQYWYTLPYSPGAIFYDSYNQYPVAISVTPAGTAGNTTNSMVVASLGGSATQDLGTNVTGMWNSGITVADNPGLLKVFQNIVLTAPVQTGTATVSLYVDGILVVSPTWDLSKGPISRVFSIPNGTAGYSCQTVLTATATGLNPVTIWNVAITGDVKHTLVSTADLDGQGGEV